MTRRMQGKITRVQKVLLLAELPILIVTLGLMAWALNVLSKSIGYATNIDSRKYDIIPPAYIQSGNVTQTVTGYRTTSVRPPLTFTHGTATSTFGVGFEGSSATETYPPTTRTFLPATYGIDATATTLRTVVQSALQPISHLVIPEEDDAVSIPSPPLPTPAPIVKRQGGSSPVRLAASEYWSVNSTTYAYEQYYTVTVNHGFGRYFLEAGIDYVFLAPQGYSTNDLARIRALTALVSLALISIVSRIACTLIRLFSAQRQEKMQELQYSFNSRILTAVERASTILLMLTYIPFWALYGAWTNRNSTVKAADAVFRVQDTYFGLNTLLRSTPWQGKTSAFIVFWTLSIISSIVVSFVLPLYGRNSRAQEEAAEY